MTMSLHGSIGRPSPDKETGWLAIQCGHCGTQVSAAVIAIREIAPVTYWLLCPACYRGSVITYGELYPSSYFGPVIEGLPQLINKVYTEARACMSVSSFTACELLCRKLLMYIAVDKGAKEGQSFVDYISQLETQGYITPPMKSWADLIRQHGNKATHLLEEVSRERAENTLMFTAELLRLIYEMEHISNKYKPKEGGE